MAQTDTTDPVPTEINAALDALSQAHHRARQGARPVVMIVDNRLVYISATLDQRTIKKVAAPMNVTSRVKRSKT